MKFTYNTIIMLVVMMTSAVSAGSYSGTNEGCFSSLENFKKAGENPSGGYTILSCSNLCGGYPLIALSGNACYCGNAIPPASVKSDSESCDKQCPLWSENACGDSSVYIVYLLDGSYASTAADSDYASVAITGASTGASSGGSSKTTSQSATKSSSSSSGASSPSPTGSSTSSDSSSSSASATTTSSSSATSTSSASSTSSTSSSASGAAVGGKKSSGGGISGGAIAGIVVGVVVGVLALVAAVAFFIIWKRRHRDDNVYTPSGSPTNFKSNMGSFRDPYPPQPPRQLMDPRLNPAMLGDPRISIASLADARDYSRQILTVTNPDEKA